MNRNKILLIAGFVFFVFNHARSQSDDIGSQIWIDYNPKFTLSDNWKLSTGAGYRTLLPNDWSKYYLQVTTQYTRSLESDPEKKSIDTWQFGGGYFYTANTDTTNKSEIRLMQGYGISWPSFKRIKFKHLIRIEERFFSIQDKSGWDMDIRARYKLSFVFSRVNYAFDFMEGFYLPFSAEIFFNLEKENSYGDVMRLTPGIGNRINDKWRMEFNVSYHYMRNTAYESFETNNIVFRLRVFTSF